LFWTYQGEVWLALVSIDDVNVVAASIKMNFFFLVC
jgi:hypothetical protein